MLDTYSPEEAEALIAEAEQTRAAQVELARTDFDTYAELVLKDEKTGADLEQAWVHEMMTIVRSRHRRAVIISATEMGKSAQFSVGFPTHELGLNPRGRFAVVQRAQKQALDNVRTAASYIDRSDDLHSVFPDLVPGEKWGEQGYFVKRPAGIRFPSLSAMGMSGSAISGFRSEGFILDDILDSTNTRTKHRNDENEDWFFSEIYSRMTDQAWCYFVGNAWNPDDLYHRLERRGWPTYRFPVIVTPELVRQIPAVTQSRDEGGFGLKVGDPTWKKVWPKSRIEERKAEVPPHEFNRAQLCEARNDSDAKFKRAWLKAALEKGWDLPVCDTANEFLIWDEPELTLEYQADQVRKLLDGDGVGEGNFFFITGVDTSTGEAADRTALVTIAVDKDTGKRFLLEVISGLWLIDDIIKHVIDVHARYGSIFMVENNGMQRWLLQLLGNRTAIVTYPHTTGRNKADPRTGIDTVLAGEFFRGKWVVPSANEQGANEEIQELFADMIQYTPDIRVHTGDRLMALWFAQTLAVRLERQYARAVESSGVVVI